MKIAFVHFHLKTGGVISVLKRQIAAVAGNCELLVLTGDRAAADLPCKVVEIPELGYDRPDISPRPPDQVAEQVRNVLGDTWTGGCDVLHVHNPTLAKNRQFLRIIKRLQSFGINLFLQIHDFAEDGRPNAYFDEDYPENCHYGVINTRDADILRAAGLDASGLHLLPNAVDVPGTCVGRCPSPKPRVLYPVRAIRRKNMGEAILLSMFFKDEQTLAVTQPPNSPMDTLIYRDWIRWVKDTSLHVDFAVGNNSDFSALMMSAQWVVTTSISEGFGLMFLEPWTAGKLLWGRRLGDICRDFEESGIRLNYLYDRLDVPLAWIDADAFSREWHKTVIKAAASYGRTISTVPTTAAFARMVGNQQVDFGLLSEKYQRQVLTRLIDDSSARAELIWLNPWLPHPGEVRHRSSMVENNRGAVLQHYGMQQYRKRLMAVYDHVLNHDVCHHIDKPALQDAFFDLDRFSLLKWGCYDR